MTGAGIASSSTAVVVTSVRPPPAPGVGVRSASQPRPGCALCALCLLCMWRCSSRHARSLRDTHGVDGPCFTIVDGRTPTCRDRYLYCLCAASTKPADAVHSAPVDASPLTTQPVPSADIAALIDVVCGGSDPRTPESLRGKRTHTRTQWLSCVNSFPLTART